MAILNIPLQYLLHHFAFAHTLLGSQFADHFSRFLVKPDVHVYFSFRKSITLLFASSTFFWLKLMYIAVVVLPMS